MSTIKHNTFDGIRPVIAPRNLPPNCAQTCENIDLSGSRLDPWKVPLLVQAVTNTVSIFPWRRNSTTEWLSWSVDTDVVQSPVADDTYERIYLTDGVKPKIIGWYGGAKVEKDMERPTATAPTATATDRAGWTSALASGAACVWGGTRTVTYHLTTGGVTTEHTSTTLPVNFIGTVLAAQRDRYTGVWTIQFSFQADTVPMWSYLAAAGTRVSDIAVEMTGAWSITYNGTTYSVGGSFTINDGSVDYGTAVIVASLPTPTYTIGKASVVGETFTGSVQLVPTWVNSEGVKYVRYAQTWIDEWGMEGPASTASNEVTWIPGQKIVLSGFGTLTGSKRRFYRCVAGTSEDTWYYLCELTSETTYSDILTDSQLGEEIPLFENPQDTLKGIVMLPANFAAAFKGRNLYFSEPDYPWSWPTDYMLTTDWDIVGLGVLGNDLYITTKGCPYVCTGYHPESMTMAKIPIPQACVAKRSMAPLGQYMIYASPDGLVGLSGGTGRLLTAGHYGRTEWQALTPSGMISASHDDCYFGFHSTGGIMFWLGKDNDSVATTDQVVTAAFADLEDDTLYIVQSTNIYSWNRGATYLTMKWRGKEWASDQRQDWTCGRIEAETYNATLRFYAENVLVQSVTVTSHDSFRVAKMTPERTWSIQVESSAGAINMVAVSSSKMGLVNVGR